MQNDDPGIEPLDPSPAPRLSVRARHPWWVVGRGLTLTTILCVLWTGMFLARLFEPTKGWFAWSALLLTGLLAVSYIPSIVYFILLRRQRYTPGRPRD